MNVHSCEGKRKPKEGDVEWNFMTKGDEEKVKLKLNLQYLWFLLWYKLHHIIHKKYIMIWHKIIITISLGIFYTYLLQLAFGFFFFFFLLYYELPYIALLGLEYIYNKEKYIIIIICVCVRATFDPTSENIYIIRRN